MLFRFTIRPTYPDAGLDATAFVLPFDSLAQANAFAAEMLLAYLTDGPGVPVDVAISVNAVAFQGYRSAGRNLRAVHDS